MALTLERPIEGTSMFDAQSISPAAASKTSRFAGFEESDERGGEPPRYLRAARAHAERFPVSPQAWARLAQAEQSVVALDRASEAAVTALRLAAGPADSGAAYAAGVVLLAVGDQDVLRRVLMELQDKLPTQLALRIAIEVGKPEEVRGVDSNDSTTLFVRGWLALESGKYAEAVNLFRRARREVSVGPSLLINLGYAHAAAGSIEKAIRVTREAVALAPRNRTAAFNLAGFLRASGDVEGGLAALRVLQGPAQQPEIVVALAQSEMLSALGDDKAALKLLQRTRTSQEWARASQCRRAELEASLSLLRVRQGVAKPETVVSEIFAALKRSEFESLEIGSLLASVARQPEHAAVLAQAIDGLQSRHSASDLLELRFHHAALSHDPACALKFGRQWVVADPLNPVAAAMTAHVLCDLDGSFSEAAAIGLAAIRRVPAYPLLLNNTAYALILDGRLHDAHQVLRSLERLTTKDPITRATRALLVMFSGDVSGGLAGYQEAEKMAVAEGNKALGTLIRLNAWAALLRLQAVPETESEYSVTEADLKQLRERPEMWILRTRIERERRALVS